MWKKFQFCLNVCLPFIFVSQTHVEHLSFFPEMIFHCLSVMGDVCTGEYVQSIWNRWHKKFSFDLDSSVSEIRGIRYLLCYWINRINGCQKIIKFCTLLFSRFIYNNKQFELPVEQNKLFDILCFSDSMVVRTGISKLVFSFFSSK